MPGNSRRCSESASVRLCSVRSRLRCGTTAVLCVAKGTCTAGAGAYCGVGMVLPIGDACPRGSYSVGGSTSCTLCAAGRFGASTGLTNASCSGLCPIGQYSTDGAVACSPCPAGTFGNASGLTTSACAGACLAPVAYYCPAGCVAWGGGGGLGRRVYVCVYFCTHTDTVRHSSGYHYASVCVKAVCIIMHDDGPGDDGSRMNVGFCCARHSTLRVRVCDVRQVRRRRHRSLVPLVSTTMSWGRAVVSH